MSAHHRMDKAFKDALELPLLPNTKYVIMSDCHRGVGNKNDNFFKNKNLCFVALKYYYQNQFTYIELGDGEELWENKDLESIQNTYHDIYRLFAKFHETHRFYMLYGNHDIAKHNKNYVRKKYARLYCTDTTKNKELFQPLSCHESIILRATSNPEKALYLTHGHQVSLLNSTFWPLAQFLVRYLWKPLEHFGITDPTSAAKNYYIRTDTEKKLNAWATDTKHILIAGHTHRPLLTSKSPYYCNAGSLIHPNCITCIEIENTTLTLVKWCMRSQTNGRLYLQREIISKPVSI